MQLFDYDQDGVVNKKEGQGMLRCLGLATDDDKMAAMVSSVGVDTSHHSLSFNEFLSLVSRQRREEPSDQGLRAAFRSEAVNTGLSFTVPENCFADCLTQRTRATWLSPCSGKF